MPCLQPFAVPLLLENQTWKNIGPVITRFWKGRALKKKKKQRLGPVTLDFSRLFLTNRARFYSHLSRENRLYVEISEKMERELHDVDIFLRERNVTWF